MKKIVEFLVNNRVNNGSTFTVPEEAELAVFQYTNVNSTFAFYSYDAFEDDFGDEAFAMIKKLKGLGSSVTMNDCTIIALS